LTKHKISAQGSFAEQGEQFIGGDAAGHFGAFEQAVGEFALFVVQRDDLFFNRAAGDQAINGYRALLANAVRAV